MTKETAMASVNTEMMVTVNMPAVLSSTFVEGAASVVLIPGDNMPFTHLSWSAPQAMVVETGVTFILQPVEIGANQVPLPIGDPHPITCGPFECAMGMDAPEVTIENSTCAPCGSRPSSFRLD